MQGKFGNTLVVNLFGSPGSGKSTMMSAIFAELKWKGIICEIAPEYAKEKVWANSLGELEDQLYIFAKQQHRLFRVNGKVDVILTDSPILLSIIYGDRMKESFHTLVKEQHSLYRRINFFLTRAADYDPIGRLQTEEEADVIGERTKKILDDMGEKYLQIEGKKETIEIIIDKILKELNS